MVQRGMGFLTLKTLLRLKAHNMTSRTQIFPISLTILLLLLAPSALASPTWQNNLDAKLADSWKELSASLPHDHTTTIAIMPIVDGEGHETILGQVVADLLGIQISKEEGVRTLERSRLEKILEEKQLTASDLIQDDANKRREVGQLLGADDLLFGEIHATERVLTFRFRLVSVETGEVLAISEPFTFPRESVNALLSPPIRVPKGFDAATDAKPEPYTGTGWADRVIHDKTGIEMVFIPAGEFLMGSPDSEKGRSSDESPLHAVQITKPFYMAKYEVTVNQFGQFVQANGYQTEAERGDGAFVFEDKSWRKKPDATWRNPYFPQTENNPVGCMSWNDAQAFCDWAGCQLPSEAEWEYTCRAGANTAYHFGDKSDQLGAFAWYRVNNKDITHPVGEKLPNKWGLYDMYGNAWEWCEDWYGADYYKESPSINPEGPKAGSIRILRGGSCFKNADQCRSANRTPFSAGPKVSDRGFRVIYRLE